MFVRRTTLFIILTIVSCSLLASPAYADGTSDTSCNTAKGEKPYPVTRSVREGTGLTSNTIKVPAGTLRLEASTGYEDTVGEHATTAYLCITPEPPQPWFKNLALVIGLMALTLSVCSGIGLVQQRRSRRSS